MSNPPGNISSVQVLRGLAVMLVVFYHMTWFTDFAGPVLPEGHWLKESARHAPAGVFMFFVISGFVVPLSMWRSNYHISGFLRFMGRRMIRLEPPYLITIALILLLDFYFHYNDPVGWVFSGPRLLSHLFYLVPFTGQEWYNPIFWTLAIEFQFYIFIGLFFTLLDRGTGTRRLIFIATLSLSALSIPDNRVLFYYLPVFALGMSYFLWTEKKFTVFEFVLAQAMSIGIMFMVHPVSFCVAAVFAVGFIFLFKWKWKPLLFLGDISYSLYLIHGMAGGTLLFLFYDRIGTTGGRIMLVAGAMGFSIAAAWVFYHLIEKPAMRLSRKLKKT